MLATNLNFAASTADIAISRIHDSWAWYVIKASGLTAFGMLILLMVFGIGHVTGLTYRFVDPVKAWAIHKVLGIILGVSILVHIAGLFFDHYINFGIIEVFIPFVSNYTNKTTVFGLSPGRFAVASGVFAAYGCALVILSSLDTVGWIKKHKKLWKLTHITSYAVIFLVIMHALGTGTDFKETIWRLGGFGLAILLIVMTIMRLMRTKLANKNEEPTS